MNRSEFELTLRSSGRSFGDDQWEVNEAAYVAAWKSAVSIFRERDLLVEGGSIKITMDWAPMLRRHERHRAAIAYIYRGRSVEAGGRLERARFPRRSPIIRIVADASFDRKVGFRGIVETILYDIFIIMNIAAPGCCSFYMAELAGEGTTSNISLSSSNFELSLLQSKDKNWPRVGFVPLNDVVEWYASVRSGISQIPNSSTERAIFALFHIARAEADTVDIIWLFYALESLLRTGAGENFGAIVRRLGVVLNVTGNDLSQLKKRVRLLYDLRSKIVHGGFEVMHPINDDGVDRAVLKSFEELLDASDYGHALLIASIQRMIGSHWSELRFEEVLVGVGQAASDETRTGRS